MVIHDLSTQTPGLHHPPERPQGRPGRPQVRTIMNIETAINNAMQWRLDTGRTSGIVVIHGDTVQGWVDKLRDPEHWCPGCIAIDAGGNAWVSTGGNDEQGAQRWVPTHANKSLLTPIVDNLENALNQMTELQEYKPCDEMRHNIVITEVLISNFNKALKQHFTHTPTDHSSSGERT